MTNLMCSIYDKAAGAYMVPFFCRTKAEAIRMFTDACGDGKSNFCKHPADFDLMVIGVFDDNSGVIAQAANEPLKIITALECIQVVDLSQVTADSVEDLRGSLRRSR